eukprot:4012708-Pyramimonas_sp.AAC.1
MGPPGYFWKLGPMRDAIEDFLRVVRMRCCNFSVRFDRSSRLPSGAYLQVATTRARIPVNP